MGYSVLAAEDVAATPDRPCLQRALGEAAGVENLAVNRYTAEPGEQIPLAYHYHDDQEELFYVLEGELGVETPEGTYRVGADELFVAEPGSPHRAYNPAEATDPVRLLAVGAPAVDDAHAYDPDG
jgi:uncharacterized cupin superfamily protein